MHSRTHTHTRTRAHTHKHTHTHTHTQAALRHRRRPSTTNSCATVRQSLPLITRGSRHARPLLQDSSSFLLRCECLRALAKLRDQCPSLSHVCMHVMCVETLHACNVSASCVHACNVCGNVCMCVLELSRQAAATAPYKHTYVPWLVINGTQPPVRL